ncbi:MAG: oligosaccharide flippase family protein [Elusimicrobiota bacterium]
MIRAFIMRFGLDMLSRFILLGLNILIARKLLVSDFGLLTYAMVLANLFYVFTEMGANTYLLKKAGEKPENIESYWNQGISLKFLMSIAVLLLSVLLLPALWPWKYPVILLAMVGWMIGNSFVDFYQLFCNATHDFKSAANVILSSRFLMIAGMVFLFIAGKVNLLNVTMVYFSGSLIGALAAGMIFMKTKGIKFAPAGIGEIKDLFRIALPFGVANIFGIIYLRTDSIFLTWLTGTEQTGIYGAAFRIFEMVYAVPAALMLVTTPLLLRAKEQGYAHFIARIKRIAVFAFALAAAWMTAGFFFSGPIINFLYGERYMTAAPVLSILALANGAAFFSHIAIYLMVVLEKQKRHALNQLIALILNILLTITFIYKWGTPGAAAAVLATQLIIIALCVLPLIKAIKTYETYMRSDASHVSG